MKHEITSVRSTLKIYLHMLRNISTSFTFGTILAKSYQVNIVIRTFNFANLSCVLEYVKNHLHCMMVRVSGTLYICKLRMRCS